MLVCLGCYPGSASVWVPTFRSSVLESFSRTFRQVVRKYTISESRDPYTDRHSGMSPNNRYLNDIGSEKVLIPVGSNEFEGIDFEGWNWTRMVHDHAEALLWLPFCCRIGSSKKNTSITFM